MPLARIPQDAGDSVWFITPTVWNWYYVFDRHNRWQILADSLQFLQQQRGLIIHAYVFMLNHLHLIVQHDDAAGIMRDFKKYTSRELRNNIRQTEPSVLKLFETNGEFRFWKEDNQPKRLETERFYLQKLRYIHDNPVRKGYVDRPEYWRWSSANPESPIRTLFHDGLIWQDN